MTDIDFMRLALVEAEKAAELGEVPIGAVVVKDGAVIARGRNRVEEKHSVSAHAEFEAIHEAEAILNDWRMSECTIYVTKEPCPMCAGMLINSRVKRIVYGAGDPAGGFCGGAFDINSIPGLLWHPEITGGVCGDESLELIRRFFRSRRAAK
jgi:tRNA(adenine34) deaminase